MTGRYIVLWSPNWPLNALTTEVPPGTPAAIIHGGRVSVTTACASGRGVRVGMTRTLAQYHCPDLLVLPEDKNRERAAFETVLQVFDAHASSVSVIRPGLAFAPAHSASKWAGSEEALTRRLVEDIALETGAEVQVGIANGLGTALVAARKALIVPAEETEQFLRSLPLRQLVQSTPPVFLPLVEETLQTLAALGVRDGEQLLALGKDTVIARFGATGQLLLQMLDGDQPLVSLETRPELPVECSFELDPPAETLQFATTAMARVSRELAEKLRSSGLRSSGVKVRLESEAGRSHERTWIMLDAGATEQVVKRVTWQVRGWLNSSSGENEETDPLKQISLTAVSPRSQAETDPLWGSLRASWKAEQAAEEVQDMLGETAVLQPRLVGGFDPRTRVSLTPWGLAGGTLPELPGPWDGGVSDPPIILYAKPPSALLLGTQLSLGRNGGTPDVSAVRDTVEPWKQNARLWVDRRGRLNGVPTRVIVEQDRNELSGGDHPVESVVRLWVVRGRWWQPEDLLYGPRCYLRLRRLDGGDLLLVQRKGNWEVEGIYGAEYSVNSPRDPLNA